MARKAPRSPGRVTLPRRAPPGPHTAHPHTARAATPIRGAAFGLADELAVDVAGGVVARPAGAQVLVDHDRPVAVGADAGGVQPEIAGGRRAPCGGENDIDVEDRAGAGAFTGSPRGR
jgi:hypothetical protein